MPAKQTKDSDRICTNLALSGSTAGRVKLLSGFSKKVHTEPDAVNSATQAFLARLCGDELASEAETFFQNARATLGYKRKEIALDVTSPLAVLTTRDFTFEIGYALLEEEPASYAITRRLHALRDGALVHEDAFNTVFRGLFSTIEFALGRGVRVEAMIDAIEELDDAGGLAVTYPSDCCECTVTLDGVDAAIVVDGATLALRFPRASAPRDLFDGFERVRAAFTRTEHAALATLLG